RDLLCMRTGWLVAIGQIASLSQPFLRPGKFSGHRTMLTPNIRRPGDRVSKQSESLKVRAIEELVEFDPAYQGVVGRPMREQQNEFVELSWVELDSSGH